jgi:flagellar biogenesis protein FliO
VESGKASVVPGTFDVTRVLLATVGVIGLILVMRAGVRKIFPSTATHRGTSAVKVLSRCTISPRQHLLVVQFGKRLVLVGDSGSHLNPLCEIADPDEAANVLAQAREESVSVARKFDSLFGRARKDFDSSEAETAQESFDNSDEVRREGVSRDDPAIQETQKELADLHDKVREVARRIGHA